MYPLDLDAFRLASPDLCRSVRPPRHQRGQHFLKGPIPWGWLQRAMALPGKALHVGLVAWFHAGVRKAATVSLPLNKLHIPRTSARRGLRALEAAGLVSVKRHDGRSPIVTLLEVTDA